MRRPVASALPGRSRHHTTRHGLPTRQRRVLLGPVIRVITTSTVRQKWIVEAAVPGKALGSDQAELEHQFSTLVQTYPGSIAVRIGFDEGLSHLIEAGVDCFLMPSRFEPCGLNQMYSQRYGTPPIVHATGGLLDTVVDYNPSTLADGTASGFLFYPMQADTLLHTIQQAIRAYHNKKNWQRLQKNGMAKDFGWPASAATYRQIYLSLLS